jgi:nucleoside-diphosphate-sugar epimerase
MKVLVTGAAGMLGAAVMNVLRQETWQVITTGRAVYGAATLAMDIGDWEAVMRVMEDVRPD